MATTFEIYSRVVPFMIQGFKLTLFISITSVSIGLIIGLTAALMKISKNPLLRYPATGYIEVFRGTPLLVQILFMSFAYPTIYDVLGDMLNDPLTDLLGFTVNITSTPGTFTNPDPLWDVIIVFALNTGAYQAEIFRAGIQSIPTGQAEAGRSLGLTYAQTMRYIIIPQAFRVVTPALAGEFINMILNSSLASVVAVQELTYWTRQSVSIYYRTLEIWFLTGIIYLTLTLTLSRSMQYFEAKYSVPGLGVAGTRRKG